MESARPVWQFGSERTIDWGLMREGDPFETLFTEMLPVVYRYATSRLGQTDGEDVTGEVFHAAAALLAAGQGDQVTPSWLMAVTKNKVIDQWRKRERRGALAHLAFERRTESVSDPADADGSERWYRIMATLDGLPIKQRTLLMLRYVDDLPVDKLADLLDSSESAIESALARARKAFRQQFEEVTS